MSCQPARILTYWVCHCHSVSDWCCRLILILVIGLVIRMFSLNAFSIRKKVLYLLRLINLYNLNVKFYVILIGSFIRIFILQFLFLSSTDCLLYCHAKLESYTVVYHISQHKLQSHSSEVRFQKQWRMGGRFVANCMNVWEFRCNVFSLIYSFISVPCTHNQRVSALI